MPEETTQLNFRIEASLLESLKKLAEQRGVSYTDIVRSLIKNETQHTNEDFSFFERKPCRDYEPMYDQVLWTKSLDLNDRKNLTFDNDIFVISWEIKKNGSVPDMIVEKDELMLPIGTIANCPQTKHDDLGERIERKSKQSIYMELDRVVIRVLNDAITKEHSIHNSYVDVKSVLENLKRATSAIDEHNLSVKQVLYNPNTFEYVKMYKKWFEELYETEVKLIKSIFCQKNTIYLLSDPEYVGRLVLSDKGITKTEANDPKCMREGNVYKLQFGVGILNDYAIAKVYLDSEDSQGE